MSDWAPRSGFAKAGGFVWLPRLLDKFRHGEAGGYHSLEDSLIDLTALKLWGVTPDRMRAWVSEGLSEAAIAERIRAAGVRAHRVNALFLALFAVPLQAFEADENRMAPGPLATLLKGVIPILGAIGAIATPKR